MMLKYRGSRASPATARAFSGCSWSAGHPAQVCGFGHNGAVDIAVDLVEAYLRLNGYFTLTELDVQKLGPDGRYESLTDVDVVAVRFPGQTLVTEPDRPVDTHVLVIEDPVLELEPDTIDVIIGEVKEGPAELNPGLTDHATLHTVLRRLEWLYPQGVLPVVHDLRANRLNHSPARGGGELRTRLVAFGRAPSSTVHTIALAHVVHQMVDFFDRFEEVLRPAQFKDPATALLRLLVKSGFTVTRLD